MPSTTPPQSARCWKRRPGSSAGKRNAQTSAANEPAVGSATRSVPTHFGLPDDGCCSYWIVRTTLEVLPDDGCGSYWIVRTTLEVGRPSTVWPFRVFTMAASYWGSDTTGSF